MVLDYRFKYQINQLAMANDDDEYEQKIEVNRETIAKIIQSVNLKPQGISREINPEMFIAVQSQIQALVQQGNEEAIEIAQDMAKATLANTEMLNAKIASGKEQILKEWK